MEFEDLDFSFVSDKSMRQVLEEYHAQTVKAAKAEAYLATIVGCGSLVEGSLTWALLRRKEEAMRSPGASTRPLEQWNLSNLIDVSIELGMIGRTAERASWALKDFRNFIHPYNVVQQSARPGAPLAMGATAAVLEIRRSLVGRLSP